MPLLETNLPETQLFDEIMRLRRENDALKRRIRKLECGKQCLTYRLKETWLLVRGLIQNVISIDEKSRWFTAEKNGNGSPDDKTAIQHWIKMHGDDAFRAQCPNVRLLRRFILRRHRLSH